MSGGIAEFSEADRQRVAGLLEQRYGWRAALELAESELQLEPDAALQSCPTLYWTARGAHFVVCKLGADRYRCEFFYSDSEHYGTGRVEYGDCAECVLALLRVQSDHEREREMGLPAAGAARPNDDYLVPSLL